jgi:outer membrane protein OmpA-like peptidoglycan-associated protein
MIRTAQFTACLLLLLPLAVPAAVQRYGATEHESRWQSEGSPLDCSLRHEIPGFGAALFRQAAGGQLEFTLHTFLRPPRAGEARLLSVPPAWRHQAVVRDLGTLDFADRTPPFRLPQPLARRLLAELKQGMFPTVTYKDWADGADNVSVHLSAVNVVDALGEFVTCVGQVLPFTFDDVRDSRFHFALGSTELDGPARARLDRVAAYLKADRSVRRVELNAYTDNSGFRSYNRALSAKRAGAVRDYLAAQGVDAALITIKTHGESKPIASNRTASGREQNRRVELALVR